MPKNRGNTGHRGYKMRRIIALEAMDGHVWLRMECHHDIEWSIPPGHTAEEWAAKCQDIVGKSGRCEKCQ